MEEERSGEMCAERRFLLNLFASIHDYDDKGESTVIRTIQFFGWLAIRAARMQQFVDAKEASSTDGARDSKRRPYELFLAMCCMYLPCLSSIENHATWGVMMNALKMLILSIKDVDVVRYWCRCSLDLALAQASQHELYLWRFCRCSNHVYVEMYVFMSVVGWIACATTTTHWFMALLLQSLSTWQQRVGSPMASWTV